jgi:hypothetical protein
MQSIFDEIIDQTKSEERRSSCGKEKRPGDEPWPFLERTPYLLA